MQIFLDTANRAAIKKWAETGLIDGVTTNPSHLSKEGDDPKKVVLEIAAMLPNGVISVEVTEQDPNAVYEQAKKIARISDNIVVKVPCYKDYYPVIRKLVADGVKLNITLVFSLIQATMMAKLGAAYVSPFIGRWEDIDVNGIELLPELREMIDGYNFDTKILAASIRSVRSIHDAICSNVDAITIPPELFEKAISHILTDTGMALFNKDWAKLGVKQFP